MKLANNFEEFLIEFNNCGVSYLIVGGYAVIFHGYGRTTGDLDIWLEPVSKNKAKVVTALRTLKLSAELINHIESCDFTKPFAVKLGDEPIQIDLFNAITALKYEEAEENSISYTFSNKLDARFIDLNDLITNKMLTGRLKDKADVEQLQKIRKYDDKC